MDGEKVRPRKAVTAARIEVSVWFEDADAYERFAQVPFGPKAITITDRAGIEAWDHGERGITAKLVFTHTCRNSGAHVSDSKRFFNSTANSSSLVVGQADLIDVALAWRDLDVPQVNRVERLWTVSDEF